MGPNGVPPHVKNDLTGGPSLRGESPFGSPHDMEGGLTGAWVVSLEDPVWGILLGGSHAIESDPIEGVPV